MAETASRSRTLSEDVYLALRTDILRGRLGPGQKLRTTPICARFGVSLSVVREALTRLAADGLVRSAPQVGFSVVTLDPEDLRDLTRVRVAIETLALRGAIERGDLEWETLVVAACHRLEGIVPFQPEAPADLSETWASCHADFHHALAAGCGSPHLLRIRRSLFDASEIYRRWTAGRADDDRDILAEHRAIKDAALKRDADLACALLASHIHTTTNALLAAVQRG